MTAVADGYLVGMCGGSTVEERRGMRSLRCPPLGPVAVRLDGRRVSAKEEHLAQGGGSVSTGILGQRR